MDFFNGRNMKLIKNKLSHVSSTLIVTKAKTLEHGQFEAVLSTEDLDRHNEIVSIKGMQIPTGQVLKMYYNHETTGTSLPIGKWLKVWKKDGKLVGLGEVDLEDDFALKVYKKIKKGYLDSISIGFYPLEYDGDTGTWTKSTLVEASVVAEPANVSAQITSKQVGYSEKEFNHALVIKMKESDIKEVKAKVINEKGEVADVLTSPKKWELMQPFYDVTWAFADAFYSDDVEPEEFNKLLTETIGLLQTIVDGTYEYKDKNISEDAADTAEMSAINELKSRIGAVEAAVKANTEKPAIKTLIKLRGAAKEVGQAAEQLNKSIKIKLKESQ